MSPHAGRRVLIAGCGELGTRLATLLAADGAQVYGLRRGALACAGVETLRADLCADDGWPTLPADLDAVVFCAAPEERTEEAYRALYVGGLRRLLARLDGKLAPFARIMFASSSAVWGELGGVWVDEETPPRPPTFNGRVLLEAEQLLDARAEDTVVVRLAGLYGPGRSLLLRRSRSGEPVRDQPPNWTNRIHLEDAARAFAHLLALPDAEPLYIGVDDMPAPEHEVLDWLAQRQGLPPPPRMVDPAGRANKKLSNRRLRLTGFDFLYPNYCAGYAALL